MDEFQDFDKLERNFKRVAIGIIIFNIIVFIVSLGILGALGYVAYHFIQKFW